MTAAVVYRIKLRLCLAYMYALIYNELKVPIYDRLIEKIKNVQLHFKKKLSTYMVIISK